MKKIEQRWKQNSWKERNDEEKIYDMMTWVEGKSKHKKCQKTRKNYDEKEKIMDKMQDKKTRKKQDKERNKAEMTWIEKKTHKEEKDKSRQEVKSKKLKEEKAKKYVSQGGE